MAGPMFFESKNMWKLRMFTITGPSSDKDKERRFPHIHCLVYFSYDSVKTEQEAMNFWAPLQLKAGSNEDLTPMTDFQKELQQAWYAFVEKKWGKTVRQFSEE
jgi:hypothetical protein